MRCPQFGRFKPEKRAVGAPRAVVSHAAGKGAITVEPQAAFKPLTLATFRVDPKTGLPRGLGEGLKGMPKAQRDAIKARRAALVMNSDHARQHAMPVLHLSSGDQKRDRYKSRDDRHRHYAWKRIG
jgi:hypothetical protein